MKIETVKKYFEAYEAYINGTEDEFCAKYGVNKNELVAFTRLYLEKLGSFEEIEEYKKRNNEIKNESKPKNTKLDGYKIVNKLLNNIDDFEYVMDELKKQDVCLSGTLSRYYNVCDDKEKPKIELLSKYYKDSRLLREIDRMVSYKDNRPDPVLKPVDESVYDYVQTFIESTETSIKAYDTKNGHGRNYFSLCISKLKRSNDPRAAALVAKYQDASKNPLKRFKKYHPELIGSVRDLYIKIIKGNFCAVDFYLEKDEELSFEAYKLISKYVRDNSANIKKNRALIGTIDELLKVDTIERNLLETKLIFKNYGEVSLEVNAEVVNYMKENNIPLKFPLFRQLIIKYVNNELSLENDKVLKKTK